MSATTRLYTVQPLLDGKVSIARRPRGSDWLLDEITMLRTEGVDVLVSLLTSGEVTELDLTQEAEICQSQGMLYLSYPINDHSIPAFSTEIFALLEQLKTHLAAGKHIAAHCRIGLGRSALIAASVLVLSGLSPESACERLSCARGYTVPETEEQQAWVRELPQQYRDFCALRE